MSTLLGCKPVLPGFVSCSGGGGDGGGGKSASVSLVPSGAGVPSPSAGAPPAVEDLLVGTVSFADDGGVSGVEEGTGRSRQERCPSGWLPTTLSWLWSLLLWARKAGGAGGGRSASGMSSQLSSKSKASPSSSSAKNTGKRDRRDEEL